MDDYGMTKFGSLPWKAALDAAVHADDGGGFRVLSPEVVRDLRPVLLWIHPGDAVEDAGAFACTEGGEDLHQNSRDFQDAMGEAACGQIGKRQTVILHRLSDGYAFDDEMAEAVYQEAMEKACAEASTLHLFGDDLDAAADWLIANLGGADGIAGLPIYMIGAYSHPEHGCLAHVGQRLEAAGAQVEVHPCSPSEPGSCADAWVPAQSRGVHGRGRGRCRP